MGVGLRPPYGADDDAAAGSYEEESTRVPEREQRAGKSRILDELVELTGWHRDHARAALREALVLKVVKPRTGRPARVSAKSLFTR